MFRPPTTPPSNTSATTYNTHPGTAAPSPSTLEFTELFVTRPPTDTIACQPAFHHAECAWRVGLLMMAVCMHASRPYLPLFHVCFLHFDPAVKATGQAHSVIKVVMSCSSFVELMRKPTAAAGAGGEREKNAKRRGRESFVH